MSSTLQSDLLSFEKHIIPSDFKPEIGNTLSLIQAWAFVNAPAESRFLSHYVLNGVTFERYALQNGTIIYANQTSNSQPFFDVEEVDVETRKKLVSAEMEAVPEDAICYKISSGEYFYLDTFFYQPTSLLLNEDLDEIESLSGEDNALDTASENVSAFIPCSFDPNIWTAYQTLEGQVLLLPDALVTQKDGVLFVKDSDSQIVKAAHFQAGKFPFDSSSSEPSSKKISFSQEKRALVPSIKSSKSDVVEAPQDEVNGTDSKRARLVPEDISPDKQASLLERLSVFGGVNPEAAPSDGLKPSFEM